MFSLNCGSPASPAPASLPPSVRITTVGLKSASQPSSFSTPVANVPPPVLYLWKVRWTSGLRVRSRNSIERGQTPMLVEELPTQATRSPSLNGKATAEASGLSAAGARSGHVSTRMNAANGMRLVIGGSPGGLRTSQRQAAAPRSPAARGLLRRLSTAAPRPAPVHPRRSARMAVSTYLVFGDLHGRVLPAFRLAAAWQREHGERVAGLLQVGDLGYFPDVTRLDKATKRHAARDRLELGVQDVVAAPASRADRRLRRPPVFPANALVHGRHPRRLRGPRRPRPRRRLDRRRLPGGRIRARPLHPRRPRGDVARRPTRQAHCGASTARAPRLPPERTARIPRPAPHRAAPLAASRPST